MSKTKQNEETSVVVKDERSVFYATKKGFANVFVYPEDMVKLGFEQSEVEAMTNGKVNEIFRESLGLEKRASGKSGYKKELVEALGLTEGATQSEINQAMLKTLSQK